MGNPSLRLSEVLDGILMVRIIQLHLSRIIRDHLGVRPTLTVHKRINDVLETFQTVQAWRSLNLTEHEILTAHKN